MAHGIPAFLRLGGICLLVGLVVMSATLGGVQAATVGQTDEIEPDTTLLDISVGEDGTASWEIRYRVRLDDENATAAFDSLASDVRENRSAFTSRFASRIQQTVSAAENGTAREMAVENVSVETERQELPQRYGALVYSFEWVGFAENDGSAIEAGDAIAGLYLDGSTALTIDWPAGYGATLVDPAADDRGDRSATWRGPTEFSNEQPRLVFSPSDDEGLVPPVGLVSLLVVIIVLAGLLGVLWFRRVNGGTDQSSGGEDVSPTSEPLLSNDERVLKLLRENGGRMKQQQVVESLGWTDAKTSQVVRDLRESGEIEGFRLGRENVLRLPDEAEGED